MAREYGKAGHGARQMGSKRELKYTAIAGLMLLLLWLWFANIGSMTKLGLPVVILMVFGFRMAVNELEKKGKHFKKRANDAYRGARAEEKVAERLASLPESYVSFHDLSFPGFNVDHIAVGPGGVFVIETKSHGGKVTNNGNALLLNGHAPEKDFINQTWSQTYHIRNLIKEHLGTEIPAKPVLCFSNAFVQVRGSVKGVDVVNGGYLNTFIAKQKTVLNNEMIKKVSAALRSATSIAEPEKRKCPHCQTELVLRQYQSGQKIGQQFYACLPCKKGFPIS